MTGLTKLSLNSCDLCNTETLRPLTNLIVLSLNGNQDINIYTLQYLTKLTSLYLNSCGVVSLDFLRPLTKLEVLDIYDNKVVFIQPILELKYLSILSAGYNKLIDIQTIEQHSNFKNFVLNIQDLPTNEELKVANILRIINHPVIKFKQIYKQACQLNIKSNIFKKKLNECLQKLYSNQVSFIAQAAFILQNQNAEGFQ
ncbi:leucine-rich_repeat domain-containing protein [Hexamita inflata]|uniref:Leucine-rich repeat domain-containing protein n=1 Tax=Hexamita inflata TaxID=28002 RepID=A0AA86Q7M4_9EUKA|nr:leucine-rich repeat domain-containing protein [Hexamita inflata]